MLIGLVLHKGLGENLMANLGMVSLLKCFANPSASPTDPRLGLSREILDDLSLRDISRYRAYGERLKGIEFRLSEDANREYYQGRTHLQNAQKAQVEESWDVSRNHYRSAISKGTEQIKLEAYLLLGDLLRERGDEEGFRQAMKAAYEFTPNLSIQFGGCPSMTLLGSYIDERDLELNVPIHVILVWELAGAHEAINADGENWHFFSWRDKVFQVGTVENLVPDGGFESRVLPSEAPLHQMPMPLFRDQEIDHTTLAYESQRKQNLVLVLNGKGDSSVGLGSRKADISTDRRDIGYLITGRYRSTSGAAPHIGVRWWLQDVVSWNDNESSYLVQKPSERWERFAGLLTPPDDASEVQIWVLNLDKTSSLRVDNLGLFRVPVFCVGKLD
jgi:hypothetical protein